MNASLVWAAIRPDVSRSTVCGVIAGARGIGANRSRPSVQHCRREVGFNSRLTPRRTRCE
eukprot:scaffold18119_cov133-Isochrysis_galbana.AAC.2